MRRAALLCPLAAAALAAGVARAAPDEGTVNATVVASPLSVTVLAPTRTVRAGRNFRIQAQVSNAGRLPLSGVTVTLVAPLGLVLRDPATQAVPRIDPAGTRRALWDLCAQDPGGYVVLAQATAGPFVAESLGELVEVEAPARRRDC